MINGIKYLTINTDASFNNGVAGWAAWVKNDEDSFKFSGVVAKECSTNNAAEMSAIINALHVCHRNKMCDVDKIVINTDSQAAIDILTNRSKSKNYENYKQAFTLYEMMIGKPIYFKKVKGHTKGHDPRHFINVWCDKEARRRRKDAEQRERQNTERVIRCS